MGVDATKQLGQLAIKVLSFLVSIFTIIAAFRISPLSWNMSGLLSLMLPLLLLLNFLFSVIWFFKKQWIIASLCLISIISNFSYITSILQINTKINNVTANEVKIATYNIHSFNNSYKGYYAKKISEYMKNDSIDILCFQEYSSQVKFSIDSINEIISKYYRYRAVPMKNKKYAYGLSIFSNYPILKSAYIPFDGTDNNAMYCDILISRNKTIRLLNLHLQTTDYTRNMRNNRKSDTDIQGTVANIESSLSNNILIRCKQAQIIQNIVKLSPYPVVLVGDFNSLPSEYPYKLFTEYLKDGFKECGSGYMYTYNNLFKLLRIDYILVDKKITGLQYYSPNIKWSDHNPVIMNMYLN